MQPRLAPMLQLAAALLAAPVHALPPRQAARFVEAGRSLVGTPYQLGGRLGGGLRKLDGIDCQGVLFFAAQVLAPCGWKSYAVLPTESVARGELGQPLFGGPVGTRELSVNKLEPADIILLVGFAENPVEPPIGKLDGRDVWVWHTGLYAGAGRWIVGDHYAGQVIETPLRAYLEEHADAYAGALVTRMKRAPAPLHCRHHVPMRLP